MSVNPIDEYIAQYSPDIQTKLEEIRTIIKSVLPADAEEIMSYGMPAYRTTKNVVYFGAAKNHLGFYPGSKTVNDFFANELTSYKTTKGSIHFPYTEDLPAELIKTIVQYRLDEINA